MATPENLTMNWDGETEEAGLYLAFAKKAEEEGYPEIAQAWEKAAIEEAWHAADVAKLQGKVKTTKENLQWRIQAEKSAQQGKAKAGGEAQKEGNTTAAEWFMRASADEGRHAAVFEGLMKRFF